VLVGVSVAGVVVEDDDPLNVTLTSSPLTGAPIISTVPPDEPEVVMSLDDAMLTLNVYVPVASVELVP
jgi:hypothetical protein